jgi:hypothetical protein
MGVKVENRFVMVHDKTNGQWELQSSIKHNELKYMRHLIPMMKDAFLKLPIARPILSTQN